MEGPETAESKGRQQPWWKVVCRASLVALTFYALYWCLCSLAEKLVPAGGI